MTRRETNPLRPWDDGSAVVVVLLIASLLTALGVGLVSLSNAERLAVDNYRKAAQLLYAAEAIAERAVHDLEEMPEWSPVVAGTARSAFSGSTSGIVAPWGETIDVGVMTADLQQQTDPSVLGPNTPRWRAFAWGAVDDLLSEASENTGVVGIAWVADDPYEEDAAPSVDSNGLILLRVQALGHGGLRRSVQVVLERHPADGFEPSSDPAPQDDAETTDGGAMARILRVHPMERGQGSSSGATVRVVSWREMR